MDMLLSDILLNNRIRTLCGECWFVPLEDSIAYQAKILFEQTDEVLR